MLFAWSRVEAIFKLAYVRVGDGCEIGLLRIQTADEAVAVLVATTLLRAVCVVPATTDVQLASVSRETDDGMMNAKKLTKMSQ